MFQKRFLGEKSVIDVLTRVCGYPASVADIACDKVRRYLDTYQKLPPAKGAFLKYTKDQASIDKLVGEIDRLDQKILKTISRRAARNPAYNHLYVFENFQKGQKGPVQKVTPGRVLESVDTIIENSEQNIITDEGKKLIDEGADLLRKQLIEENLHNSIHERDIRPQTAWSKMAHSRVRGLP